MKYSDYTKYIGILTDFPIVDLPPPFYKPYFQRDLKPFHLKELTKSIVDGKMINYNYWFWKFKDDKLKVIEGGHRFAAYINLNLLDPKKYKTVTIIATIVECDEKKSSATYLTDFFSCYKSTDPTDQHYGEFDL